MPSTYVYTLLNSDVVLAHALCGQYSKRSNSKVCLGVLPATTDFASKATQQIEQKICILGTIVMCSPDMKFISSHQTFSAGDHEWLDMRLHLMVVGGTCSACDSVEVYLKAAQN